eukprot:3725944-Amphidinium_carterae.1
MGVAAARTSPISTRKLGSAARFDKAPAACLLTPPTHILSPTGSEHLQSNKRHWKCSLLKTR